MSNSKYVSHSPIDKHLKCAEPRTVSFPPFRDIGPPTHLLGVGGGNLTSSIPDCCQIGIIVGATLLAPMAVFLDYHSYYITQFVASERVSGNYIDDDQVLAGK